MAHSLSPLPPPGLSLFPGFTAPKPETLLMKDQASLSSKASALISFATPAGEAGAPFLELKENKRKNISFMTLDGREVMRIVKQTHPWSGRGPEYHGMRGDGVEVWHLKLHSGLSGTDYRLTINTPTPPHSLTIRNKVLAQDKGILLNGTPVATMSRHEEWSHFSRQDLIHVAPGMDMLLALGVNWIRIDKQNKDAAAVVSAVV